MLLDVPPGADASPILQAAIDSGPVELPAATLALSRPVYLTSGAELTGRGARTVLDTTHIDALVALPPGMRNYNPAPHLAVNPLDPRRWSMRTRGTAGIRIHNSRADLGWDADYWRGVRAFTVEVWAQRYPSSGGLCGLAWRTGGAAYRPAPWWISQRADWPGHVNLSLGMADGRTVEYRFPVGNAAVDLERLRFRVDLVAGSITCDKNGAAVAAPVIVGQAVAAGEFLNDNPGAPLWIGGLNGRHGGACPSELGCADVAIHAFRLWNTAAPPLSGYSPFQWVGGTVLFLPMSEADKPKRGDPAIGLAGENVGLGYFVPFSVVDWCAGLKIEGVSFRGFSRYGAGLSITSATDVDIRGVRFQGGAVGVQAFGGPLNNYPVRIRDIFGHAQSDCLARLHWCIATVDGVTAKYPGRSVMRIADGGATYISDVFHAGENGGPVNTVSDVMRVDCHSGPLDIAGVLSNYEDGYGPRNSYLKLTGPNIEPSFPARVRVRDWNRQALRAGASYMDAAGLAPEATVALTDSF